MKELPAKADQSLTAKTKEPSAEAGQSSNAKTSAIFSHTSVVASVASAIAAIFSAYAACQSYNQTKAEYGEVVALRERLGDTVDRVNLYGDLAAAEGGDRLAYVRANRLLRERKHEGDPKAAVLLETLRHTTERFMGDVAGNPVLAAAMAYGPLDVSQDAGAMLRDTNPMQRIHALRIVSDLKRYSLFPDIFASLENEPDLGVVQMALHVINGAFIESSDAGTGPFVTDIKVLLCVLNYEAVRVQFNQAWKIHKEWLLSQERRETGERRDADAP